MRSCRRCRESLEGFSKNSSPSNHPQSEKVKIRKPEKQMRHAERKDKKQYEELCFDSINKRLLSCQPHWASTRITFDRIVFCFGYLRSEMYEFQSHQRWHFLWWWYPILQTKVSSPHKMAGFSLRDGMRSWDSMLSGGCYSDLSPVQLGQLRMFRDLITVALFKVFFSFFFSVCRSGRPTGRPRTQ